MDSLWFGVSILKKITPKMMLLEKIKEHGGKIMFFTINVLIAAIGVLFVKQRDVEKENAAKAWINAQDYESATDYAYAIQKQISDDQDLKIKSVADNTGSISKEQIIPVTKTIPAVTEKIIFEKPTESSKSATAKTTTPKAVTPKAVTPKATTKAS